MKGTTVRKLILYIVLAILCGVVALIGFVSYLGSPSGSQRLLGWVQTRLERDYQTHVEFEEGRFSLFSGFHFKNLKVHCENPTLTADALIEELRLTYSFSILHRQVHIFEFALIKPKIKARLQQGATQAPGPGEEPQSLQDSLTQIEEQIKNPPASVQIDRFAIEDLNLEAQLIDPESEKSVSLKKFSLTSNLNLHPKDLKTTNKILIGNDSHVAIQSGKGEARSTLTSKVSGQITIATSLEYKGENERIGSINVDGELGLDDFLQTSGKSRNSITRQVVTIQTKVAEQKINTRLLYKAAGIHSPDTLLKPANLTANLTTDLSTDLKNLQVQGDSDFAGTKFMTFSLETKTTGEKDANRDFKSQFDMTLARQLSEYLRAAEILKTSGPIHADATVEGVLQANGDIATQISAHLDPFKAPGLTKPLTLGFEGNASWKVQSQRGEWNGDINIENADYGNWLVHSKSSADLSSGLSSQGQTTITPLSEKPPASLPVQVLKPFTIAHVYSKTPEKEKISLKGDFPLLQIPQLGRAANTGFTLDAQSTDFAAKKDLVIEAAFKQSGVALDASVVTAGISRLSGLTGGLKAALSNSSQFSLEKLEVSLTEPKLRFSAQGRGDINRETLNGKSELDIVFPKDFSPAKGQKLEGHVNIPTAITVLNGREVSLDGVVTLLSMTLQKDAIALKGLSGRIPFSERLKILKLKDSTSFRFAHLIEQNPFERVDFERVRPLLQGTEILQVNRIKWEEREFGPFIGYFSLRQNMLMAHQFDLDLGSGRMFGQFFIDATPKNMQVGLLSRLTGLDLFTVLPQKFLKRIPKNEAQLAGRTGVVLNLDRHTIDGRLDVTKIGGAQLIALINVLDPTYEDEKLNSLRNVLQVGYPTSVEMGFADGYLNMDITLEALGVLKNRQSVRGIPISSLIASATSELRQQAEKGPLK